MKQGITALRGRPTCLTCAGISGELMKDNDNLLRNMFFTILRHHQPKMATKLDVVYALSSAWTLSESDGDFEMLEQRLKDLNPDELIMVCSCWLCV